LDNFAEMLESEEGIKVSVSTESKGSKGGVDDVGYFFDGAGREAGEGTVWDFGWLYAFYK